MIIASNKELPDSPDIFRLSYIEGLIRHSTFDHEWQARTERELTSMAEDELLTLEMMLLDNQLDNITESGNYSVSDIIRKIR